MARVGASSSATSTRLGICSGLATLDGLNTEKTVPPDHRWSCCEARKRASGRRAVYRLLSVGWLRLVANSLSGRGGTRTLTLFRARAPKTLAYSVSPLARV